MAGEEPLRPNSNADSRIDIKRTGSSRISRLFRSTAEDRMLKDQRAEWKARLKLAEIQQGSGNILHFAIEQGYVLLAADALRKGLHPTDLNAANSDGMSPFGAAIARDSASIVALLVERGAQLTPGSSTALHQNVNKTDRGSASAIIRNRPHSVDVLDENLDRPLHKAVQADAIETAEMLMEKGCDINAVGANSSTPLQLAVRKQSVRMVKLLLRHGANRTVEDSESRTPLHEAITLTEPDRNVISLFLDGAKECLRRHDRHGATPLHYAVLQDQEWMISDLVKAEPFAAVLRDDLGVTPLEYAIMLWNPEYTKLILTGIHQVSNRPSGGIICVNLRKILFQRAPLPLARTVAVPQVTTIHPVESRIRTLEALFDHGKGITKIEITDTPALHEAVMRNDRPLAEFFLVRGKEPDVLDDEGKSPLFKAVELGSEEFALLLLDHGADVALENDSGETSVFTAIRKQNVPMLKILLRAKSPMGTRNALGQSPLHVAARMKNLAVVETLLNHSKTTLSLPANDGSTPIIMACKTGPFDVVLALINAGASANDRDELGMSALHHATQSGNVHIVRLLLDNSAAINAKDGEGTSPVHIAIEGEQDEILELFCEREPSLMKGQSSVELLAYSARSGNDKLARKLLDHGVNPNAETPNGELMLNRALPLENSKVALLLLSHGASATASDEHGLFPLGVSVQEQLEHVTDELLRKGADPNVANSSVDTTPLQVAVSHGNEMIVASLLKHGAAVDTGNKTGIPALVVAASKKNLALIDMLLQNGADPNCIERVEKKTPLHIAAAEGHLGMAKLLVAHGAKVDVRVKVGLTPLHIAVLKRHENVAEFLLAQGADGKQPLFGSTQTLVPIAASHGWANLVRSLISHGADPYLPIDESGHTALSIALNKDHLQVLEVLLEAGISADTPLKMDGVERWPGRRFKPHPKAYRSSIERGFPGPPDYPFVFDTKKKVMALIEDNIITPLMYAAGTGSAELIEILLRHGADPNIRDSQMRSVLHVLMCNTCPEEIKIVKMLMDANADPNVLDLEVGVTATHVAIFKRDIALLKAMLPPPNDRRLIGLRNSKYKTSGKGAMELAIQLRFEDAVREISKVLPGCAVWCVRAIMNRDVDTLRFLLRCSVHYDLEREIWHNGPLDVLFIKMRSDPSQVLFQIAKVLFKLSPPPNLYRRDGQINVLHWAAHLGGDYGFALVALIWESANRADFYRALNVKCRFDQPLRSQKSVYSPIDIANERNVRSYNLLTQCRDQQSGS